MAFAIALTFVYTFVAVIVAGQMWIVRAKA
jgi:hypothetical protein